ncbi:MAG: hypothetical protein MJA82_10925 [Clostridia bacterium]|nr:hypothetical protein [Clostridia bacterium]
MEVEVVLHVPDPEYASQLFTEQAFYVLRNRINKYSSQNNLGNKEKAIIYRRIREEMKKKSFYDENIK